MLTEWQTFLLTQGARIVDGSVLDFGATDLEAATALSGNLITDLSYLGVITISGEDAADFLNGQLTTDISQLANGSVQPSAWCNPKGQVITNFFIARLNECFYILLPRELQESILKRLQKFILRAAVVILDDKGTRQCMGVKSIGDTGLLQFDKQRAASEDSLISIPIPGSNGRWIIIGTAPALRNKWLKLAQQSTAIGSHYWQLFDILDGLPWITVATTETCLPQSLNLDQLQGLSYQKGCYPGQEVIARLHYRGKYSQRLFIAKLETIIGVAPGAKIYTGNKPHSIGTIINTAWHPKQGCYALTILEVDYINPELLCLENSSAHFFQISTPHYLTLNQE